MVLIHKVCLTDEDRTKLHALLKVGEHSARTIVRGYVLLLASQGKSDDEIAQTLEVGRATVQRVRKRYCQKGLDYAFTELGIVNLNFSLDEFPPLALPSAFRLPLF